MGNTNRFIAGFGGIGAMALRCWRKMRTEVDFLTGQPSSWHRLQVSALPYRSTSTLNCSHKFDCSTLAGDWEHVFLSKAIAYLLSTVYPPPGRPESPQWRVRAMWTQLRGRTPACAGEPRSFTHGYARDAEFLYIMILTSFRTAGCATLLEFGCVTWT